MSKTVELTKEQMISVKRGQIENDICGDLATPFVQIFGRGIWLWHDTVKGVFRSIKNDSAKDQFKKFEDEAYNIKSDKSTSNIKLKTAQIVKLWIEGVSLCFEEMAEDYDVLRDVFNNDSTYYAIDQISQITYSDWFNLTDRIKKYINKDKDTEFWHFVDSKMQEFCKLYETYRDKPINVNYILQKIKIVIETLCSCFIFFEERNF